jgi:hypothetical protein
MNEWFSADTFLPHGVCLSWDSDLVSAVVVSNALIATAYMMLASILVVAARAPRPAVPRWVYWSFALFIFCCGLSHVLDDVTLWLPLYRLQAVVLCLTAVVSIFAAVLPISIWIQHEAERWRR